MGFDYRCISNIRRTRSPNSNVSHLILHLSLPNLARCQVENEDVVEQRRQAMLQLHPSDKNCLPM